MDAVLPCASEVFGDVTRNASENRSRETLWNIIALRGPPNTRSRSSANESDRTRGDTPGLENGVLSQVSDSPLDVPYLYSVLEHEGSPTTSKPLQTEASTKHSPAPRISIAANGDLVIDTKNSQLALDGGSAGMEAEGGVAIEVQLDHLKRFQGAYTRSKGIAWTPERTQRFYDAVAKHGSDLMLVKSAFPELTEKAIRAKYRSERRRRGSSLRHVLSRKIAVQSPTTAPRSSDCCLEVHISHSLNSDGAISHLPDQTSDSV